MMKHKNFFPKNKCGMLLAEETLKIVISVISITFLVGFLASLYFNSQTSKDLELAESSLNHISDGISLQTQELEIYNPTGWSILSWKGEDIPLSCLNLGLENCLCICKNPLIKTEGNFLKNCDKKDKGICVENVFLINEEGKNNIQIKNPPVVLQIDYQNKLITTKDGSQ